MAVVADMEVKFRLNDGTDIGPNRYPPSTSVLQLKESIISGWPAGKEPVPRSVNDLLVINAGKPLDNGRTLGESIRVFEEGGSPLPIITMHVLVKPSKDKEKAHAAQKADDVKKPGCGCTIL